MRKTTDINNFRFPNYLIDEIKNYINSSEMVKVISSKKNNIPHFTYVRIWGDYGIEFRINGKPYGFFKTGNYNGYEKAITLADYLNKQLK